MSHVAQSYWPSHLPYYPAPMPYKAFQQQALPPPPKVPLLTMGAHQTQDSSRQSYNPETHQLLAKPKSELGSSSNTQERSGENHPHVINTISGGSNEPEHRTKRQRKMEERAIYQVSEGNVHRTSWSHVPVTFSESDIKLVKHPHDDPLVIRANMGRNSHRLLGNDIGRILVYNGSATDIITWQCFT